MAKHKILQKPVEKALADHFKGVEINSIEIVEDTDFDGDDILRIRVFFTTESDRLDPNLTSSFVRNLRPKLPKSYADRFPVMSFISNREKNTRTQRLETDIYRFRRGA